MKKLISLALALFLCASILAASLQTVCLAAQPNLAPAPTATGEPNFVNGLPGGDDLETTE